MLNFDVTSLLAQAL